jgi:hypothetical protein
VHYLAETFDENWIQCCTYQGWAHEECSGLEPDAIYFIVASVPGKENENTVLKIVSVATLDML